MKVSSHINDESLVPASLAACQIDEARRPDMRRKIEALATDDEDRQMLLSMILDE